MTGMKRSSGHKVQKQQGAELSEAEVAMDRIIQRGITQGLRSALTIDPGEALVPGTAQRPVSGKTSRSAADGRGLTWEILQKVCPVPNADRRAHADLFRKFANFNNLRDDEAFYRALLAQLRTDPGFVQNFNIRYCNSDRRKDKERAFSVRVHAWLCRAAMRDVPISELLEGPADLFPNGSAERELHELLRIAFILPSTLPQASDADSTGGTGLNTALAELAKLTPGPDAPKWGVALASLIDRVVAMVRYVNDHGQPNSAIAESMADCARLLHNECLEHETALAEAVKAESEAVAEDRQILQSAIERLDDFEATLDLRANVESLAPENLRLLRPIAERILDVTARRALVRSERDEREAVMKVLQEARNWAAIGEQASALAELTNSEEVHTLEIGTLLRELGELQGVSTVEEPQVPIEVPNDELSGHEEAQTAESASIESPISSDDFFPNAETATIAIAPQISSVDVGVGADVPDSTERPAEGSIVGADEEDFATGINDPDSEIESADDLQVRSAVDTQLASYLDMDEVALAYHLSKLAEDRGLKVALPSSVLKALAAAPCLVGPFDATSGQIGQELAEAMSAVEATDRSGDRQHGDAVRGLVFAALLRPAVMAPDTSAREHLQNLSMTGMLAPFAPLQMALAALGHDFHPKLEDLEELDGGERRRRSPKAKEDLVSWSKQVSQSQSVHQPTTLILRELTGATGLFGVAVAKALSGSADADTHVAQLLARYGAPGALEGLIHECEKKLGRPTSDRIRGMALDWIVRKLIDGCERLRAWLEANSADRSMLDDTRKLALRRQVGVVLKALNDSGAIAPDKLERSLEAAATRQVQRAVCALRELLESGRPRPEHQQIASALRDPLLRLPGACQPRVPEGSEAEFREELSQQRDLLFHALLTPNSTVAGNQQIALQRRIAEDAVLPGTELLDRLEARGDLGGLSVQDARSELAERKANATRKISGEIETLRLELVTLQNLDLRTGDKLGDALGRLDAVAVALRNKQIPAYDGHREPGIPADFPQVHLLLAEMNDLRTQVRAAIAQDQRERLVRIANEHSALGDDVERILSSLDQRDPTTVEDIIASLQAGQPVANMDSDDADAFGQFFPNFVEQLAGPSEEWNRGRIHAALQAGKCHGPLDFSTMEKSARDATLRLLERWSQVENGLREARGEQRDPVRQVMEWLGFTQVEVTGETALIRGQLRAMMLKCAPLRATGWFLPPEFGSIADGHYRMVLCRPEVPDDQIASELAKVGVELPTILLVFGRISRQRRQDFAVRMRKAKQRVLLIDETQVLFLAVRATNRLETLFECAAPFGYLQPYTTDPGNIPAEMFFGRQEEIESIFARSSDGCLVYGGRQLGKSALLHQVRKLYHAPDRGVVVGYRSCDIIGNTNNPAESVWRIISQELARHGVLDSDVNTSEGVVVGIREWLAADAGRRIVMLLDETDQFMSFEARMGFPILTRLKELMELTARRFKPVFAGLHNVRRAWAAPNTPLAHLGRPICVGPLNTTIENRSEARRLVVQPMRAAGFEYNIPSLGWDILARVNHYPSLVQVFCKELLAWMHKQPLTPSKGPRWKIERDQVFDGGGYQQIVKAIVGKFRLTLELDPRYDLIANVLALYRMDRGDEAVLRRGLTVSEIYDDVIGFWPDSLQRLDLEAFAVLLDEMVDLGVLSYLGPAGKRYGLRTAQVAQMLGDRRDVEEQIEKLMAMEPRVDYDAALYFRRVDPDDAYRRSPLSDRDLESLFSASLKGPRIIVASQDIWGKDIAARLLALAKAWASGAESRLDAVDGSGSIAKFRDMVARKRIGSTRVAIIISSTANWNNDWIRWCATQVAVTSGYVLPIFVAESRPSISACLHNSYPSDVRIFAPAPWGSQMLRAFLDESECGFLDHKVLRRKILEGSGGAPEVLIAACSTLKDQYRGGAGEVDRWLNEWAPRARLSLNAVGLEAAYQVIIKDLEDAAPEELEILRELIAHAAPDLVSSMDFSQLLAQLALLGMIERGDHGRQGVRVTRLGQLVKRSLVPT